VKTEKPDDNHGEYLTDHLPSALEPDAEQTSFFLRKLMREAGAELEAAEGNRKRAAEGKPMANGVWPWSGGRSGSLKKLKDRYGITGAVISAVDVIVGLGRCLGMNVIKVPGATGYIDTNYEGKADAAIDALRTHDFVYLHLEAIDEVSHEQNLQKKIRAIEDFDSRVISRVLSAFGPDLNAVVLPDHPVPLAIGKHTRVPVPVAARIRGMKPDSVQTYDEIACKQGSLGNMTNGDLMNLLFGQTRLD
ncbi:MAG: phosphoglycerate mutase, partial [Verrucomicrobia bacterium]|nr:phosphoglycerate mutase [Verrucomicrobiota bacterium]